MKICLSLVYPIAIALLPFDLASAQAQTPQGRIVTLSVEPDQVLVLHLHPGYVSSVRVLEDVSSVVLGDPGAFRAEHSEAEPQLVFFKATGSKPAQTNALIATKAGREISLSLVSAGKLSHSEPVDYILNCERPRSFLISSMRSNFVVAETKAIAPENPANSSPLENRSPRDQDWFTAKVQDPHWKGKLLRIAVGQPIEKAQEMAIPFAVLNTSRQTIEVLPPQIELAGTSREKHRKGVKAEPVAIKDYVMTTRALAPGDRADGVVVFDRPSFKESRERLLLAVAQAEEVDHPVLAPIAFVAPMAGGDK